MSLDFHTFRGKDVVMKSLDAEERAAVLENGCPECGADTYEEDIDSMKPGGWWVMKCKECDWGAWTPET